MKACTISLCHDHEDNTESKAHKECADNKHYVFSHFVWQSDDNIIRDQLKVYNLLQAKMLQAFVIKGT